MTDGRVLLQEEKYSIVIIIIQIKGKKGSIKYQITILFNYWVLQ